jgi:hypothetical protein
MNKDESNTIWKIIWSMIILFIILLFVSWMTRTSQINESMGMGVFIFCFFIVFSWILITLIGYFRKKRDDDKPRSGMEYYSRQINDILLSRPKGEPISWDGGQYSRYSIKTIFDINKKPHKYVGFVGFLKDSNRRIALIYDTDENDIVRFVGDPGPQLLNNVFDGFKPFDTSTRAFSPFPADQYGRGGVNINLKQPGYNDFIEKPDNRSFNSELDNLKKK